MSSKKFIIKYFDTEVIVSEEQVDKFLRTWARNKDELIRLADGRVLTSKFVHILPVKENYTSPTLQLPERGELTPEEMKNKHKKWEEIKQSLYKKGVFKNI